MSELLVVSILLLPVSAVVLLAVRAWLDRPLSEATVNACVGIAFAGATIAAALLALAMFLSGKDTVEVPLGVWFRVGHYQFEWSLIADHLSVPFAGFSAMLVGLVGVFSRRYLHLEPGYRRFYLLLAMFGAGVEMVVLAGSLDVAFFGWEFVGLTSALLIAFFNDRPSPVENGLVAFATYRLCDVGFLSAAVWLHYSAGTAAVAAGATATTPWSGFVVPADLANATIVGLMLVWASMGKSAQVPVGGWLPRAMEGPTPSSAIFYAAISIHLGPYILLRAGSIFERTPVAAAALVAVGVATAMHATFVGRVQTDIKSALAYASMTQVGLIFAEIGLGFRHLALLHIVGHATIRSLQVLRSPSLLHDHHHLEQAMGAQLPKTGGHLERLVPQIAQPWLYRHALERGYFDALIRDYVVWGFVSIFRGIESVERNWIDLVARLAAERRGSTRRTTGPAS